MSIFMSACGFVIIISSLVWLYLGVDDRVSIKMLVLGMTLFSWGQNPKNIVGSLKRELGRDDVIFWGVIILFCGVLNYFSIDIFKNVGVLIVISLVIFAMFLLNISKWYIAKNKEN